VNTIQIVLHNIPNYSFDKLKLMYDPLLNLREVIAAHAGISPDEVEYFEVHDSFHHRRSVRNAGRSPGPWVEVLHSSNLSDLTKPSMYESIMGYLNTLGIGESARIMFWGFGPADRYIHHKDGSKDK